MRYGYCDQRMKGLVKINKKVLPLKKSIDTVPIQIPVLVRYMNENHLLT